MSLSEAGKTEKYVYLLLAMVIVKSYLYSFIWIIILGLSQHTLSYAQNPTKYYDVCVIGAGTGGTMAAIQASRMGVSVIVLEESPWIGGMMTAAGVSAIDGNHKLCSGLWKEFRDSLYNHYGGAEKVATGWVSNTLYEPQVGHRILKNMMYSRATPLLISGAQLASIKRKDSLWHISYSQEQTRTNINCKIVIDGTETGDLLEILNIPHWIGMDSKQSTGESFMPDSAIDIIQDLTYSIILEEKTDQKPIPLAKPEGYNPNNYRCCCSQNDTASDLVPCNLMLDYGRLPNGKIMINWPNCGNDFYVPIIDPYHRALRTEQYQKAKAYSLGFLYYLQTELGYKTLSIAQSEFGTSDGLPHIPYHRESRRMKGKTLLTTRDLQDSCDNRSALYLTGIAVGNYPIDHHHDRRLDAPDIDFLGVRIPAYNVPIGCLIPASQPGFQVAEKAISVTSAVNGTTRLQPVVMGIGQASGVLAALSILEDKSIEEVAIRDVQKTLLRYGAAIMPYSDAMPADRHFQELQKLGATGIVKGHGVAFQWANEAWIYPDRKVTNDECLHGLSACTPMPIDIEANGEYLTLSTLVKYLQDMELSQVSIQTIGEDWDRFDFTEGFDPNIIISRRHLAVIISEYTNVFDIPVDYQGRLVHD